MEKIKKAGIIYTAKCKLTGEVYIGATTYTVSDRKQDHEERANRDEKHLFAQAIATYGADAFTWEQIDTASCNDELAQKEKQYILKYNSKENGFNGDCGGGFQKKVYQYSIKEGSLLNTFDCLESAANAVSAYKNSIGNACIGQNKTCKGYYWSYNFSVPFNPEKDLRKKQVVQYSLSGIQIAVYESVSNASKKTGMSKTCISRVCRGERQQSGGFLWKYKS